MQSQLFVFCLLLGAAVATKIHVIKGRPSKAHSKPWLFSMWETNRDGTILKSTKSRCGCSLLRVSPTDISSDICITAAHCIGNGIFPRVPKAKCHNNPKIFKNYFVTISEHLLGKPLDKGEKNLKIIGGQCHENWDPFFKKDGKLYPSPDDIALVKLEESVKFTDTVQPIDLAEAGEELDAGTICNVAGWGITGFTTGASPKDTIELNELDVEIMNETMCKQYDSKDFDSEKTICDRTVTKGATLCDGDSGGTLICQKNGKPVAFGIVSNGGDCYKSEIPWPWPTVYSKISYYRKWLDEEIEKLRGK